jgi:hypothetical protein
MTNIICNSVLCGLGFTAASGTPVMATPEAPIAAPIKVAQGYTVYPKSTTVNAGFTESVGSVWLSVGASPSGNISGAVGARKGFIGSRFGIGAEFGLVGGGTALPDGTLDYTIPHNNFTVNGDYTGNAYGGDLLVFLNLDHNGNVAIYGGPGIYAQSTTEVVQSNATGWYYENGTTTKTVFAGGGGIRVKVAPKLEVGVGYHSLSGVQGSIGFRF